MTNEADRELLELVAKRKDAQEWLDKSLAALQGYSRIKGVRRSEIARASMPAAIWQARVKELDAAIAAIEKEMP